jgi:hypothetical protein
MEKSGTGSKIWYPIYQLEKNRYCIYRIYLMQKIEKDMAVIYLFYFTYKNNRQARELFRWFGTTVVLFGL